MSKLRRARGLGSIRKLADGKYSITYEVPRTGPVAPRRQRSETVFGTRRDAERKLADKLAEVRNGGYADDDKLTFNGLADLYLAAKALSLEATTMALARRRLAQHIRPAIGTRRVREIRASDILAMLTQARNVSNRKQRGEPLAPTTTRNLLIATRAVLAWGVKQGHLLTNVADRVDPPASPYVERTSLSLDDVRAFLDGTQGTELEAIVPVAIGTGLRRSELCALYWSDLDLDGGIIAVRRAAANLDGKVVIKATKTKRSQRVDHLPAFVVAALQRYKSDQLSQLTALYADELEARRRQKDGYVFTRPTGEAWDPNELSRQFSRLVRRRKLPPFRFHDLRHGYASLAFAAGVSLRGVSESLGHSAIGVTDAIYVHLRDEAKREKADRLDAYLGPAVTPPEARSERA
ncbi:MAG: tyrosine-type recombinase/integrase [Acidithiobacillus sp.]